MTMDRDEALVVLLAYAEVTDVPEEVQEAIDSLVAEEEQPLEEWERARASYRAKARRRALEGGS